MYKNIKVIQIQLLKHVGPAVATLCIVLWVMGHHVPSYSIALGSTFSYIGLSQLMKSQSYILQTQQKKAFFLSMISRLIIYALPIALSIRLKDYLNLLILLLSLFTFQFFLVIWELGRNYQHYKKRRKQWMD